MTFFDWISSPLGQDAQRAIIALIVALAAYLSYLARQQAAKNAELLDKHINGHPPQGVSQRQIDAEPPDSPARPR